MTRKNLAAGVPPRVPPPAGSGTLYVVATPIGNLQDITLRALDVLKAVDVVFCEDTRVTRKLLRHFGVDKPTWSCFVGNEAARTSQALDELTGGRSLALVTDAGTPGLSDPGYLLVRACRDKGLRVVTVPGPSALAAAISASGLPAQRVLFLGFAPRKKGERARLLQSLASEPSTLVFYEAPHRIRAFLHEAFASLPGRACVAGREMTKLFEEFIEIAEPAAAPELGEYVVMFGPPAEAPRPAVDEASLPERLRSLVSTGLDEKEAMRRLARENGMPRREVYRILKVKTGERART
jgi:16S rRNA (cytidine1402-2'-O)-methyltransferase